MLKCCPRILQAAPNVCSLPTLVHHLHGHYKVDNSSACFVKTTICRRKGLGNVRGMDDNWIYTVCLFHHICMPYINRAAHKILGFEVLQLHDCFVCNDTTGLDIQVTGPDSQAKAQRSSGHGPYLNTATSHVSIAQCPTWQWLRPVTTAWVTRLKHEAVLPI